MPSAKYSCDASPERLAKGSTAMDLICARGLPGKVRSRIPPAFNPKTAPARRPMATTAIAGAHQLRGLPGDASAGSVFVASAETTIVLALALLGSAKKR